MARAASIVIGLVVVATGQLAAGQDASPRPLASLAWLAGSCWTGTFADGRTKDLVCYEWMLGGTFLRSRHRVVGGAGPYEGETVLGHSAGTGKLEYTYFSSPGAIMRGETVPVEKGLSFPAARVEVGGATIELRSAWTRVGEDRYVATSERFAGGEWTPFMRIEFVRSGPSSGWSGPE